MENGGQALMREASGADYSQFSRQRRPGGDDIDEIVQIVRQQEDIGTDRDAELSLKKFAPLPGIRRQDGAKEDAKEDEEDPVAADSRQFYESEDVLSSMSPPECDSPLPSPRGLRGHASDNNLYGKMERLSFKRDNNNATTRVDFDADLLAVSTGFESALSRQRRRTRSDPCRKPRFKGMRLPPIAIIHMPDRPSAPEPTHTPPLDDYDFDCNDEEPIDHIDPGH
ncbi:Hypp2344 [Branchiostoma lanceolatum]|uniref:Hypp2344 protein n=1 Tax=Branchiostoma lanceolatum TaxID=7740 RepID=A0A8J9ZSP1_BRALA|nr:Hypp2344 [Branchiostoma lanceolatum]